ncbi:hypothetical protein PIIN_09395, partial [Serendipita indica DSM 11827]
NGEGSENSQPAAILREPPQIPLPALPPHSSNYFDFAPGAISLPCPSPTRAVICSSPSNAIALDDVLSGKTSLILCNQSGEYYEPFFPARRRPVVYNSEFNGKKIELDTVPRRALGQLRKSAIAPRTFSITGCGAVVNTFRPLFR